MSKFVTNIHNEQEHNLQELLDQVFLSSYHVILTHSVQSIPKKHSIIIQFHPSYINQFVEKPNKKIIKRVLLKITFFLNSQSQMKKIENLNHSTKTLTVKI